MEAKKVFKTEISTLDENGTVFFYQKEHSSYELAVRDMNTYKPPTEKFQIIEWRIRPELKLF